MDQYLFKKLSLLNISVLIGIGIFVVFDAFCLISGRQPQVFIFGISFYKTMALFGFISILVEKWALYLKFGVNVKDAAISIKDVISKD